MASKKITSNNPKKNLSNALKNAEKVERHLSEWRKDFSIDYCWGSFLTSRIEQQSAKDTIKDYKNFYRKFNKFFDEFFHDTPANTSIDMLEDSLATATYIEWLKKQGLKDVSIVSHLKRYRAFGNWCVEEGFLSSFKCPIKEVPTEIKEVYTEEELGKLMVKPPISNFYDFRAYCIISLMLNTGARRNTLANIKICDVDFNEGYINFNVTKTHKVARLGLDRKTSRALSEFVQFWRIGKGAMPNDYLFCNDMGGQMAPNTINLSIAKYNKARGVEKTSIHLFRHTFAKMWITSGGDIISLASVLTHSELDMVKRYANLYGTDIKKEIQEHSAISQLRTKGGKTLKNR